MPNYAPEVELKLIYDRLSKDKVRLEEELQEIEDLLLEYREAIFKLLEEESK